MIRVDTNYILRYLVNDNIKMADIAEEILTTKNVLVSFPPLLRGNAYEGRLDNKK